MQSTADPAAGTPAGHTSDPTVTRPVRLLVPTRRRSDYWLSLDDTLHASDLGITSATSDGELAALVSKARRIGAFAEDPAGRLRSIRDALRHPRDIDEAREWDFLIPESENHQEFADDPSDRLGWWWVYDTTRVETCAERQARYLADTRVIDMKGWARCTSRAYITVKDAKNEGERLRRMIREPKFLDQQTAKYISRHGGVFKPTRERLLAGAKKAVLKAMPAPEDYAGQSPLWRANQAFKHGRDRTQLDEWYMFNKVTQTGRPVGSKNRPKATTPA
jgi:hypothetical protein